MKLTKHELFDELFTSQGINEYYTDDDGKCYYDINGDKKMMCDKHTRTQLSDTYLYGGQDDTDTFCMKCDVETYGYKWWIDGDYDRYMERLERSN